MILNDENGITVLVFGDGDIFIAPGRLEDSGTPALSFIKGEPSGIGTYDKSFDELPDKDFDTSVRFVFSRVESIDVLMDKLSEVKEYFLTDLSDHVPDSYKERNGIDVCREEFMNHYRGSFGYTDEDFIMMKDGVYVQEPVQKLWMSWLASWNRSRMNREETKLVLEFEDKESLDDWIGLYLDGGFEQQMEYYSNTEKSKFWDEEYKSPKRENHLFLNKVDDEE